MNRYLPLWRFSTLRRRIFECFGSNLYSRPGFREIQDMIRAHIPERGFFIEAGAVDGFFESNTYELERFDRWTGVLIEPVPAMYQRISVNRSAAVAFNCALVADSTETPRVLVSQRHAMSSVVSSDADTQRAGNVDCAVTVEGRTLGSIIEEVKPPRVDLLSLDVEGYEEQALRGLNFARNRPAVMLVECREKNELVQISTMVDTYYDKPEQVTERDYLFLLKNAGDAIVNGEPFKPMVD